MHIDIYQDLVCPWCYIGKHRLGLALQERPQLAVQLRWRPFQLNPGLPREGVDRQSYLATKFGSRDRIAQLHGTIEETAAREGLRLDFDRITRTPNTLDAHRLVGWAERAGDPPEPLVDAIFRAYFAEGLDIGDRSVLAELAAGIGLSGRGAAAFLAGTSGIGEVKTADAAARRIGIQAVPCFVFDGRFAIAGAQEPKAFAPLLDLPSAQTETAPVSAA